MKNRINQTIIFLIITFIVSQNLFADTHYVSKTGGHISPFDSWENAATNIQASVDVASFGDTVLVNDGTYYPSDRILVARNIIVKSINGAKKTIVDGNFPAQTNRCFYLVSASNPIIDGFTITNGYSYIGGGIYCRSGGTVQNCTISGNTAIDDGGGMQISPGSTVQNCTISGNLAGDDGGGVDCYGGTVQNCTISGNRSKYGGGVYCNKGTVQNCTIIGNSATDHGGVRCYDGTVQNCILWYNIKGNYFNTKSTNQNNCIENWTNLDNGIISDNPRFISGNNGSMFFSGGGEACPHTYIRLN